jgi:hypothetical protein
LTGIERARHSSIVLGAIGLFVVSIIGGTVLGVLVVLGISVEPNNDFWALVVALSVINAALMAAFAAAVPAGGGPQLRVGVGLLVALIFGAFVAGASMGHDVLYSPYNARPDDDAWLALAGWAVANSALMAVFAITVPARGTSLRRMALAPVAATFAASLISAGFWIGVKAADPKPCFGGELH